MTFSVRQAVISGDNSSPYSATLGSVPLQGSLLVTFIAERSGATDAVITSTGWNRVVDHPVDATNSSTRKYLAAGYKPAGASESQTVNWTVDVATTAIIGLAEIVSDSGETVTLEDATGVVDWGLNGETSITANTASLASAAQVIVGVCYTKVALISETPWSDWDDGTTDLVEFAQIDQGADSRDASWALGQSTGTGVKSVTAAGAAAGRGGILSLLAFSISGGAGTDHTRSIDDVVTVTDGNALETFEHEQIGMEVVLLTDTVQVEHTPATGGEITRAPVDTEGIIETVTIQHDQAEAASISETVTITETVNRQSDFVRPASETVGITETVQVSTTSSITPDDFPGTTLGLHWTLEAPAVEVSDSEARIRLPMGESHVAPSSTSSADTSYGISQTLQGDFDIAVQIPTMDPYNVGDCGFGVGFFGATSASDHMVAYQQFHVPATTAFAGTALTIERTVLTRVGGSMTSRLAELDDTQPVLYDFIRVSRAGDSWTVYGSTDGVRWITWATFTAAVPITKVKFFGTTFGWELGQTLRISQVYDIADVGTDLRAAAGTMSGESTWATDFASMPAWLEDHSSNNGSVGVASNTLSLTKQATQFSSAMVVHSEWVSDVEVTARFRISAAAAAAMESFLVIGLSGTYQSDMYSLDHGYVAEISDTFLTMMLRHHSGRSLVSRTGILNNAYDFKNDAHGTSGVNPVNVPPGAANDIWVWYKLQKIGSRLRLKAWADGSAEPSTWFYDGHDEGLTEPGRVWISWSQNSGGVINSVVEVKDLTITGVPAAAPVPPAEIADVARPTARWRADSLEELNDTDPVTAFPAIDAVERWMSPKAETNLPVLRTAQINGEPTVYFNQTVNKVLNAPIRELAFESLDNPLTETTLIAVLKFDVSSGTQVFVDGWNGRNSVFLSGGNYATYAGTVNASTTAADLNPHVVTATFPATRANSAIYVDGTLVKTGNTGADVMRSLGIGAEGSGANPANVHIAEVFVFDKVLTPGERALVHSYIQDRYAITVSDYTTGNIDYTRTPTDTETVTDTIAVVSADARTSADVESITDTVSVELQQAEAAAITETESITDTVDRTVQFDRPITETEAVTETVTVQSSDTRIQTDTEVVTETVSIQGNYHKQPVETVSITDTVTVEEAGTDSATVNNTENITDTVTVEVQHAVDLIEEVGIVEAVKFDRSLALMDSALANDLVGVAYIPEGGLADFSGWGIPL